MKIALIKIEPRAKPSSSIQQQPTAAKIQRNRNAKRVSRKKWKINIGTHLTISGVCTTVRPEKSGT
jgi:hypothetical protein